MSSTCAPALLSLLSGAAYLVAFSKPPDPRELDRALRECYRLSCRIQSSLHAASPYVVSCRNLDSSLSNVGGV